MTAFSEVRLAHLFDEVKRTIPFDGIELLTPSVVHGVVPQVALGMKPQQALREGYEVYPAQPDDFVISMSSHAHGIEYCGLHGGISPDYTLLRPKCDPAIIPFLKYALKSKPIIHQMGVFKTGVRMGLRLQWNRVRYCKISVPSAGYATSAAVFLDDETALIDGLIEKKRRFIDLLKEKKAALITHAVTKGLDSDVPMKDSGAAWLGEIPRHWQVSRIASLFSEVARPADPTAPVLTVSIHSGVSDDELADEDRDRKVNLSEDRTKYQGVLPGDLVYNMMRAWQGAFGAVAVPGLVSPAYVVAKPIAEFRTKFVEHLLHTKSAAEEIRRFSKGIADFRMRLYWDHFRNLRVCLPPLAEQDQILAQIEAQTRRIDGLIVTTERSADLLKEKRAALITAAVTGKIDVRNSA